MAAFSGVFRPAALFAGLAAVTAALPCSAAGQQAAGPATPAFARLQQEHAGAAPRLAETPDVVRAFGLDRLPLTFWTRPVPATPELPRLAAATPGRAFPDRPYIPDLLGAEPCPERGPGFYRIRNSDSCIHVGGTVGAGVQIGSRGGSGAYTYGRLRADIVTPSSIGDLTLTMAVQGTMSRFRTGPLYMPPPPRIGPPGAP
ncbi:hypothetical protein ACFFJB_09610 [Camelimonas abortus]|uniref:Uncharacterized protein n=1 Tax=Camelimonas abortus TaxID=1017184 RepID=A0ABV7LDZ7_9HYPH